MKYWSFAKVFVFLFVGLFQCLAHSYVPNLEMIVNKTIDRNGSRYYVIDQDVVFKEANTNQTVHEKWVIGPDEYRVRVTGKNILSGLLDITFLYSKGKRFYIDSNGEKRVQDISDNFIEDFFHFRDSQKLLKKMVQMNILKPHRLGLQLKQFDLNTTYHPDEKIRLSRAQGVINYAIGDPTPLSAEAALPGVWIEQDQFVVRKVRFPSGLEMVAKNYTHYGRQLYFPKNRTVKLGDKMIEIHLKGINALWGSDDLIAQLNQKSLDKKKYPYLVAKLPENTPSILHFYKTAR